MRRRPQEMLLLGLIVFSTATPPPSFADDPPPDPRELLAGVERDRLSLASGRIELNVISTSSLRPHEGPISRRLVVVFDGAKCKTDEDRRSLMIGWIHWRQGDDIFSKRERLLELCGGSEAVVRDGLGYRLDHHSRVIYDGTQIMQYSKNHATTVDDPSHARALTSFDPRTLGITANPHLIAPLSRLLTPAPTDSVTLVGREDVSGAPAWHVRIGSQRGAERNLWIGPPPGYRFYKSEVHGPFGRSEVVSEYGPRDEGDAGRLPVRIRSRSIQARREPGRQDVTEQTIERKAAEFNIPIAPETWTLAGLGMPVGEPVTDTRAGRVVRYWDGKALSETPIPRPREDGDESPRPNRANLLAIARRDPSGPLAFDALTAIITYSPSAPEAGAAAALLAEHFPDAKGVSDVGLRLTYTQPEGTERLFRAVLAKNPDREDQGRACLGLAEILKARSEHLGRGGPGDDVAAEAERLYDRVLSSYANVRRFGWAPTIGETAKLELGELRTLGVGKTAPAIEGEDLDGKPLALRDYRGKVVVVVFWSTQCAPCIRMVPHERELVARMKGKPFALLGVCGDEERARGRATASKEAMTWPSWWDGRGGGSVTTGWGVQGWPRVYVLDAKGIIRFKDLTGQALEKAVESLVDESEHGRS